MSQLAYKKAKKFTIILTVYNIVLENIGGIAEYASDIAETAISEIISEIRESKKGEGGQTHE